MALRQRGGWRRQLRVAEAARAVRLGRRLERPDERHLAAERDLDVAAAGQLEDRQRVRGDLPRVDVAGDAGDRDQLGLGRGGGVEERERIVDAGIDIEDQRDAVGHAGIRAAQRGRAGDDRDARTAGRGRTCRPGPT